MCHTWGLYGVKELASRSEAVLAEALVTLDTALRMHEPLLQRLKAEYLVHLLAGSCAFCVAPWRLLPIKRLQLCSSKHLDTSSI